MSNTSHHMRRPFAARTVIAGLVLLGLAWGCGNPQLGPTPVQMFVPLVVTSVSETVGSTGGGAEVRIGGTGFLDSEGGAVVIFGGVYASRVSHVGTTVILATVPAHAAGLVDLVIGNPDGQSARLTGAYTYVSPDTLDFNGEWKGLSRTDHFEFRFSIVNDRLTAISCDTSGSVTLSPAPSVNNGEFAFSGADGVAVTGRLVSARDAIGTINLPPCRHAEWTARRQS
jgi:hypothetical protein